MTVFLLTMNQTEFWCVHSQKENCHNDPIPFNVKGIRQPISLANTNNGNNTTCKLKKKLTFATREIGVSRHNESPNKGPPYTPQYDNAEMYRCFQRGPELGSMMPRERPVCIHLRSFFFADSAHERLCRLLQNCFVSRAYNSGTFFFTQKTRLNCSHWYPRKSTPSHAEDTLTRIASAILTEIPLGQLTRIAMTIVWTRQFLLIENWFAVVVGSRPLSMLVIVTWFVQAFR